MKKLILSFIISSLAAQAGHAVQEVVEADSGKQIVSVIKDIQVEDMLTQTSEFKKCRDMNPFEVKDSSSQRTDKIQKAQKCFKEQLDKSKNNKEKLQALSESLNLQHYGLVKSKNSKDILKYLSDKMYKSLTGVDPNEKDLKKLAESMKFKNKKHIDQKVFIDLYKTQLGKNALYEISRFCFQNFRRVPEPGEKTPPDNFADHWANYIPGKLQLKKVKDDGDPVFGKFTDPKDKDKIYQDMFHSIQAGSPMSDANMSSFFMECGKMIPQLCDQFKSDKATTTQDSVSNTDIGNGSSLIGAPACLAQDRIQKYRKALSDIDKVGEYFEKEMAANQDPGSIINQLMAGQPINLYQNGQGSNEESIDDLTNNTATDFLNGNNNSTAEFDKKAEACEQNPEYANCEGFITAGEGLVKAKHNVEMEMTLKRDVEMARIRKLKEDGDASLKEYLEENGHFELLQNNKYVNMSPQGLEDYIGKAYEAKKLATLAEINNKLGRRQILEEKDFTQGAATAVVKESKEERARLAQVVLFNNIITSHLELKRKDGTLVGRNVSAWKKEEKSFNGQVKESYFQNIKASADQAKGMGKDDKIEGFQIIDEILGKPKTP